LRKRKRPRGLGPVFPINKPHVPLGRKFRRGSLKGGGGEHEVVGRPDGGPQEKRIESLRFMQASGGEKEGGG